MAKKKKPLKHKWTRDEDVSICDRDGLAEAGLIPKMGATEAELTATKRHLADMRAMAFEDVKPKQEIG